MALFYLLYTYRAGKHVITISWKIPDYRLAPEQF